jgi:2-polyprenyl-3-methyl-5-hydroxy-6-metoxy-1,4-benzoquinol methylase
VIRSDGSDKNFHDHGQSQSEFSEVIKRLTEEGSTVLDPFVGGGSVAAAALRLRQKFTGIDVDRKYIETTRRRIEEAGSLRLRTASTHHYVSRGSQGAYWARYT